MPLEEEGPRVDPRENARKLRRGLGLVAAGLVIDVVDFVTLGFPLLGLGVGALSGLWLTGQFGFRWRNRLLSALACGVYCMFPPTNFFPLATILGIAANLKDPDAR